MALVEFKKVIKLIEENDKFIITAHESPDGDAIGSEYAFMKILKALQKKTRIFNADPTAHKFGFVDTNDAIEVLTGEDQIPKDINEYVLFILDTMDINNIGHIADLILPHVKNFFIIDHHEDSGSVVYEEMIQYDASSTSEIIYLLSKELGVEIDFDIAQSLFMGIVYDTGSFIYPKTSQLTFQIASELVNLGVNPNYVYTNVYETNTISHLFLQSKVLSTLELCYDDGVAIQTMLRDTILESNAKYEEADQIINMPLKADKIKVSVFFKQNLEGLMRCSLRSKGAINVAEIALSMGGGGHKTAAGFKCKDSLEKTKKVVLEKLKKYFK